MIMKIKGAISCNYNIIFDVDVEGIKKSKGLIYLFFSEFGDSTPFVEFFKSSIKVIKVYS